MKVRRWEGEKGGEGGQVNEVKRKLGNEGKRLKDGLDLTQKSEDMVN